MSNPTPSPSPAALVEAMAEALYLDLDRAPGHASWGTAPENCRDEWRFTANTILDAAHTAGFVLIPRAELEEAAEALERCAVMPSPALAGADRMSLGTIANRLRQRSRG